MPGAAASSASALPASGSAADPLAGTAGRGAVAGARAADSSNGIGASSWSELLEREVAARLATQSPVPGGEAHSDLMEQLAREFEGTVIRTVLRHTRGRRIDAALRLGIGRNTITRKIQELGLDDEDER